jgi:signal transduction histidine kinase/CheY-like chemotaxis protein
LSRTRKVAQLLAIIAIIFMARRAVGQTSSGLIGFPLISAFSSEQIAADPSTWCALRDRNGVIYFGGNSLLTFDGDRWTSTETSQLRSIFGMEFGSDGKLWVAADGELGWFERLPDSRLQYHSLSGVFSESDAPRGPILNAFSEGNGAVFVSTDHVYRWDGHQIESWSMPGSRRLNAFRINGSIYVHYRLKGLFRMTISGPQLEIPQSMIGDSDCGVLAIDAQPDHWLITTGHGLLIYRNGKTAPFAPQVSKLVQDAAVTCGVRLPDGRYAFGTMKEGIVIMRRDGSLDTVLGEQNGLPVTYITSMLLDGEGSLWATSRSRIVRITLDSASRLFDERAGLAPQVFRAITRADNRITVTNNVGVFTLDDNGNAFRQLPGFTFLMHDLVPTAAGLVACGYRGATLVTQGTATQLYTSIRDIQTAFASRIEKGTILLSEDPDPSVIAISPDHRVRKLVANLPVGATSLAEDDDGHIWMGTDSQGLFFAPRNSGVVANPQAASERYGLPKLASPTIVRSGQDGSLVVVAANGGWLKRKGSLQFIPVDAYPGRTTIAASSFAPDGSLWVVHPASETLAACIAQIQVRPDAAKWIPHSIIGLETVGAPLAIFAELDTDGRTVLWIGGTKGVLRHVVTDGAAAPQPRSPLLRAYMESKDGATRQPLTTRVRYSTRAIEFEFAEPDYLHRAALRLQTRIDGVDSDWVPAGVESRRVLTAIRDGKYTFRVRAVAETGVASEPTVFSFEVAPPWWRTTPAILLEIAALIPIVYTIYRLRIRTLQRRNVVLEQKVQERTEELAEASAAKTLFVANMSHDIRNPLNGIVGLALALEDSRLDPQQRELIATLRECTTYLSSLVDDVLDFASIEAGKVELRPGPFVPAELLNSVVTTLKSETAARGAFITIETDPDVPPMLLGDAGRIQQILVNYVSNALKYAGGHIRLAANVPPGSPGEVEFSVVDEGPGISGEEQATLFTKFSRLNGARRSHIPGTGLGLASCRLLADIMGGAVGVESEVGHGARFFLRLPLAVATEPATPNDDISLPQTTVLVVEDTDYNALAAKAVLAKLGLTCERARTGEEAIQMFTARRHNIVLLDRNLPDMDGTEVARRMREIETDGLRSVLLAITAYCTPEDRALCLQAGMDAFVGKPVTPEKLRKVLVGAGDRLISTGTVESPAQPVHAPSGDALDTSLLQYLAEGAPGGMAAQIERFVDELTECHQAVLAAHAGKDHAALAEAAHRVLGQGRMVGAATLIDAALELEQAGRRSDVPVIAAAMPALSREVAALTAAMSHRRAMQKA